MLVIGFIANDDMSNPVFTVPITVNISAMLDSQLDSNSLFFTQKVSDWKVYYELSVREIVESEKQRTKFHSL